MGPCLCLPHRKKKQKKNPRHKFHFTTQYSLVVAKLLVAIREPYRIRRLVDLSSQHQHQHRERVQDLSSASFLHVMAAPPRRQQTQKMWLIMTNASCGMRFRPPEITPTSNYSPAIFVASQQINPADLSNRSNKHREVAPGTSPGTRSNKCRMSITRK